MRQQKIDQSASKLYRFVGNGNRCRSGGRRIITLPVMSVATLKILNMSNNVKGGFQETTSMNGIDHRYIKIGRQALQTCRHRPMEIDAVLADDQKSYFTFGQQDKCLFL